MPPATSVLPGATTPCQPLGLQMTWSTWGGGRGHCLLASSGLFLWVPSWEHVNISLSEPSQADGTFPGHGGSPRGKLPVSLGQEGGATAFGPCSQSRVAERQACLPSCMVRDSMGPGTPLCTWSQCGLKAELSKRSPAQGRAAAHLPAPLPLLPGTAPPPRQLGWLWTPDTHPSVCSLQSFH